jgi:hypothetical protein
MDFVSLQCPRVGIDARKLDVFAEVIPAVVAEEALFAGDAGLDGYPVALRCQYVSHIIEPCALTRLESGNVFAAFQDYAGCFMSENAIALDH